MDHPPRSRRIAEKLARIGPAGIRIAQLLALRIDLFERADARGLALRFPVEGRIPAAAAAVLAGETGRGLAAALARAVPYPTGGNPLLWAARGHLPRGGEILLRIALPDRAPSGDMFEQALSLVAPLLPPAVDREWALASLRDDLRRWIGQDIGLADQYLELRRWRALAPTRSGTLLARPYDALCTDHVIALTPHAGLPVPQAAELAAEGNSAALEAHGIDPICAARRLFEAALEQIFLFHAAPVEPRMDQLTLLPDSRIARSETGPVEPLAAMRDNLVRFARAASSEDPGLIAACLDEWLERGPAADDDGFARRVEAAVQAARNHPAGLPAKLPAFIDAVLAAARAHDFRVPAPALAIARWLEAAADTAARLDPQADLVAVARDYLVRREFEALFALPSSSEAAAALLSSIGPLESLPVRLDRLLSQATSGHYRLPVEERRAPADRALQIAQLRLICAGLLWVGAAILLLASRDLPSGWARGALETTLWAVAAASAALFAILWRRLA